MWSIILDVHDNQRERSNFYLISLPVQARTRIATSNLLRTNANSSSIKTYKLLIVSTCFIEDRNGQQQLQGVFQIVVTETYLNQNEDRLGTLEVLSKNHLFHKCSRWASQNNYLIFFNNYCPSREVCLDLIDVSTGLWRLN